MVSDAIGWQADISARIDELVAWLTFDEWNEELEGHLQREVITISALCRKLVESGFCPDSGVRLRKFHPKNKSANPRDLAEYYDLTGNYRWNKNGRYVWGNLIHCDEFQIGFSDNDELGIFFWSEPPPERDRTISNGHLGQNTLQFVTVNELIDSWRCIAKTEKE